MSTDGRPLLGMCSPPAAQSWEGDLLAGPEPAVKLVDFGSAAYHRTRHSAVVRASVHVCACVLMRVVVHISKYNEGEERERERGSLVSTKHSVMGLGVGGVD